MTRNPPKPTNNTQLPPITPNIAHHHPPTQNLPNTTQYQPKHHTTHHHWLLPHLARKRQGGVTTSCFFLFLFLARSTRHVTTPPLKCAGGVLFFPLQPSCHNTTPLVGWFLVSSLGATIASQPPTALKKPLNVDV
jgi:hypothetical protein